MLDQFYLVEDSTMPSEDLIIGGGLHAEDLEECARLCHRQNEMLAGSYRDDGAISTGFSFQHCNSFVFDRDTKLCYLKNKRMGNFYPQDAPLTPACAFYDPRAKGTDGGACGAAGKGPRYVSGYRWRDMVNELNDPYPNMASGMQKSQDSNPNWSKDNWGVTGNFCAQGNKSLAKGWSCNPLGESYCSESQPRAQPLKSSQYWVAPGAVISAKNVTTGPYSRAGGGVVATFSVKNMQECADSASKMSAPFGPHSGANAWTFHPNYTTQEATDSSGGEKEWSGTCSLGHVREPYWQTLTPEDNGVISGFAVTSLSTELHRFLFG